MQRPRLNKFYLFLLALILLTFSFINSSNSSSFKAQAILQKADAKILLRPLKSKSENTKGSIETIISPDPIMVGDTVSVKVIKIKNEREPKVYFNKTKIPVFTLDENWHRGFIPLSANTKAGKYPLEIFYKGQVRKIDLIVNDTKYPLENLTLTKEVAALKASKIEKSLVAKALSTVSSKKLWNGKFILPSLAPKSTVYGVKRRINGHLDPDYFHKGLDFAGKDGSNIRAPEDGEVILAGNQSMGFVVNGNCIFLDHGHGIITAYLHLSKINVNEGDFVKKGQVIGKVGSSGIASGPHLHWGVYVLGMTVDPLFWTSMIIE